LWEGGKIEGVFLKKNKMMEDFLDVYMRNEMKKIKKKSLPKNIDFPND
jgi:hypothetical protein